MPDPTPPQNTDRPASVATSAALGQRFRPPRMLFNAIERPYLLSKIAAGLARQIVVLRAPPGFGKTAILKAACERIVAGEFVLPGQTGTAIERCAWITVAADTPVMRFIADFGLALDLPAHAERPDLSAMMETLGRRGDLTVLFLDGIDQIDIADEPHMLAQMFLSAPENLRIACATFRSPPLPLARLKARGVLSEILADTLAFGRSDVRRLLTSATTAIAVDRLIRVTHGWPALVQLGGTVIAAAQSDKDLEPLFAGRHADIVGFVRETMLNALSPALRRTLHYVAMFDDFSLDLAVAVGAPPLSKTDIALLEDAHPVIERGGGGWFTLHPVLRICAGDEAETDPLDDPQRLHTRASAWFAERGRLERAVSHAARGGDFSLAEEIIGRAGGVDLFLRAGNKVLEHLIDNFPAEILNASPGLTVCYAVVLSKRGNVAASRERLEFLKDGGDWKPATLAAVDRSVLDHIDNLVDVYEDRRMTAAAAARFEHAAAALPPNATWHLGWLYNHLCIIHTRIGDLEAARRAALKALGCYREERAAYAQVFMLVHLGLIGTLAGQFSAALQFCREAENLVESAQWSDRNLQAIARLASADVRYARGEVAAVEQMLSEAVDPIVRGESWVDLFTRLFWLLARSRLRIGGFNKAIVAIDKAEEVAVERALPRLKIAACIMRTDLLVRAGMIESAEQASERVGLMQAEAGPEDWTWREAYDFKIASARLALARGQIQVGFEVLEALVADCKSTGRGYHRLIGEIVAVRAAWKLGQSAQALAYLQSAIALARTHDVTQLFIDEGPEFAVVLRAIVRRFGLKAFSVDAVEFLSRIVGHGFGRSQTAPAQRNGAEDRSATSGLLSERETTVLRLLGDGHSNKEIARSLSLSEATVKFHLKNIYAKLGVSRRTMAVSVGRHLNLIKGG